MNMEIALPNSRKRSIPNLRLGKRSDITKYYDFLDEEEDQEDTFEYPEIV